MVEDLRSKVIVESSAEPRIEPSLLEPNTVVRKVPRVQLRVPSGSAPWPSAVRVRHDAGLDSARTQFRNVK